MGSSLARQDFRNSYSLNDRIRRCFLLLMSKYRLARALPAASLYLSISCGVVVSPTLAMKTSGKRPGAPVGAFPARRSLLTRPEYRAGDAPRDEGAAVYERTCGPKGVSQRRPWGSAAVGNLERFMKQHNCHPAMAISNVGADGSCRRTVLERRSSMPSSNA